MSQRGEIKVKIVALRTDYMVGESKWCVCIERMCENGYG
jgi:hypothetical protein